MRIGIDLRSLENNAQHRGIGRYVTKLIEELSKIDNDNEYIFYGSQAHTIMPTFNLSKKFRHSYKYGDKNIPLNRRLKFIRTLIVSPKKLDIRNDNLDVFFQPDINQPIKGGPTKIITVVYDLIPFIYKDIYQKIEINGYTIGHLIFYVRHKIKWMVATRRLQDYAKSKYVISISEHTKIDLLKYTNISKNKIIVTPLAAETSIDSTKKVRPPKGFKNNEPFLFYVGGADERKGLIPLIDIMEVVWDKNPEINLVLAGKEITSPDVEAARMLREKVNRCSRPKNIKLFGFISDEELNYFYKNCEIFVFPSIYEGFGLPVLEAMEAGCPVVSYNNSSIPEVAGDAALLAEDGNDFAQNIIKIINNKNLKNKLINKGLRRSREFSWSITAKKTLEIFEKATKK